MNNNFNPWHPVVPHTYLPDIVKSIIEIPKGIYAKYELDKERAIEILDNSYKI